MLEKNSTPPIDLLSWFDKWFIQVLLLAIAVALTYSNTFDVPFYLDDFSSIQENPVIYNWQGTLAELWHFAPLRIIGYLSFALNYQIHQFEVAGYHLVNIIIHFLTGCAVLALTRGLLRTPALEGTPNSVVRWLPLIVALIFLLHPLQIQAVTYTVQRLASLAALFYLGAMACFIQARLSKNLIRQILWILACLLFMALAFFTKQNTATLPFALLLLELIFFPKHIQRLIIISIAALTGLIILWLMLTYVFEQNLISLATVDELTRETPDISRLSYFATQMTVLWKYISLFFWPFSAHIDYDYPIIAGFLSANTHYHFIARVLDSPAFGALLGHLLLVGIALYHLRRLPLIAFGILFYYLAHAVESSLIPIRDVIFEHRTYLPNLGIVILCAWFLMIFFPKLLNQWLNARLATMALLILLIALGTATWLRNNQWRDPVALWRHNVEQSPNKQRGWVILGKHLVQRGQQQQQQGQTELAKQTLTQGIEALNRAIVKKTYPDGSQSMIVTPETALNLVVAYKSLRQYNDALKWIQQALALKDRLRPFDQAKFLVNQGNIYFEVGRYYQQRGEQKKVATFYQQSEASYRQAIQTYPHNLKAHINLASLLGMLGRFEEAVTIYQKILAIDPSNSYVEQNLLKIQEIMKGTTD
jgi:tetratricopeptide (TPR) repeat protein